MLKLNLGSGTRPIYGFVNIDVDRSVQADLYQDCFVLPSFKKESVDLILASHILEHASRHRIKEILSRWYEILKFGGILRVCVPDIQMVMKVYSDNAYDLDRLYGFLWGGQRNEFDVHKCGFDQKILTRYLKSVGFKDVQRFDWQETEHGYIDCYAESYLPHKNKLEGDLMSLNLEAVK